MPNAAAALVTSLNMLMRRGGRRDSQLHVIWFWSPENRGGQWVTKSGTCSQHDTKAGIKGLTYRGENKGLYVLSKTYRPLFFLLYITGNSWHYKVVKSHQAQHVTGSPNLLKKCQKVLLSWDPELNHSPILCLDSGMSGRLSATAIDAALQKRGRRRRRSRDERRVGNSWPVNRWKTGENVSLISQWNSISNLLTKLVK